MTFLTQIFWKGKPLPFQAHKFPHVLNLKIQDPAWTRSQKTLSSKKQLPCVFQKILTQRATVSTYHGKKF